MKFITDAEYLSRLKKLRSTLYPLERYKGALIKIKHSCSNCKGVVSIRPNHVLNNGVRCNRCFPPGRHGSTAAHKFKLGSRVVYVVGYEAHALKFLLTKGIKPEDIRVATESGVPKIKYDSSTYHPDIFVKSKNLIVEAKSLWTFGLMGDLRKAEAIYKRNCQKALASRKAGYNFFLYLLNDGFRVKLPQRWFTMSHRKVIRKLGFKTKLVVVPTL